MENKLKEGDACIQKDCKGFLKISLAENCKCHICPPCTACLELKFYCSDCDWVEKYV